MSSPARCGVIEISPVNIADPHGEKGFLKADIYSDAAALDRDQRGRRKPVLKDDRDFPLKLLVFVCRRTLSSSRRAGDADNRALQLL
jgi:hypothetical protein